MAASKRTGAGERLTQETTEIAQNSASAADAHSIGRASFGSILTGLASTVALVFSAVSLYHSVLKQPQLEVHLPQVVHYTRDPNGNQEVFAIPLTIANHGARDGTVVDLELVAEPLPAVATAVVTADRGNAAADGSDGEAGETGGANPDGADGASAAASEPTQKVFYAAYSVDGDFFVPPGRFNMQQRSFERVDRPKAPFAPIAVAGRSAFSGTLLFYTKGAAFPKIVAQKGAYRLTLAINTRLDSSLGWLDRLMTKPPQPVTLEVGLPYFSETSLLKGGTHRLKSTAWSSKHRRADQ